MRPFRCKPLLHRRPLASLTQSPLRRNRYLTTLAVESSCDDTGVAILHRDDTTGAYTLPFNERVTSDHRATRGVEPIVAVQGHTQALAPLIRRSLAALPVVAEDGYVGRTCASPEDGSRRMVPDFVTATRGPGGKASLAVGLNTAKGLAAAWGVPFVGAHHMMAHALTPRLARALGMKMPVDDAVGANEKTGPDFPFLTLMISGGHTQLVYSKSLTDHRTVVPGLDSAVGNVLDQAARDILPPEMVESADDVSYGALLEKFAFPNGGTKAEYAFFAPHSRRGDELFDEVTGYDWVLPLPFRESKRLEYSFSGIASRIKVLLKDRKEGLDMEERKAFARHTMSTVFRHAASRLCIALSSDPEVKRCNTLVVAGGVACNKFLMHVLRTTLRAYGHRKIKLVVPPPGLCTDNAAMIAWAGMELYEAGYTTDLSVEPIQKWPMSGDEGLMGVDGWIKSERE